MNEYQRTRANCRRSKRFEKVFNAHERSKRNLQKAARDIERFTYCLFGALKYQERAVAEYHTTVENLKAEHHRLSHQSPK